MQLGQSFNVNEMPEGTKDFEPVPAGMYTATIGGAEIKDTNAGDGQYISMRLDITGPSHEGRVVFTNLNIRNKNPKAEEIARQQLGEIMRATGLATLTDTDQLIGGALQIKVAVRAATEQYAASNDVKGFKAIDGSAPPAQGGVNGASAGNAQAGAAAKAPWEK